MATNRGLGKLTYEDPREVWANEAQDFTPWLADNIDALGEALGMDIEIEQLEAPVGAFAVDLFGKEVGSGRSLIIENQLERTDHGHLGQLLAYAAGLDARIVVWISPEVRDEHRQTIDWLNEHSKAVAYFAVELEVLRIDRSLPAPRFTVVAEPREVQRDVVMRASDTPNNEDGITYQEFFVSLVRQLRSTHPGFTSRDPDNVRNARSIRFGAGRSGFSIEAAFDWVDEGDSGSDEDNDWEEWFGVKLTINTRRGNSHAQDVAMNEAAFGALHDQRGAIERELGLELEWERLPEWGSTHVGAFRDVSSESPEGDLEVLRTWAVDLLPRFRAAFAPRIAALDLDAFAATTEEAAP